MERRKAQRIHSHFTVSYLPLRGATVEPVYTLSNDISETGINLDLDSGNKAGDALELNIFSGENEGPLKTFARIVWVQKPPHDENYLFRQGGLEFIDLGENQKNKLKRFIFDVEKEDKTQTRDEFIEIMSNLCQAARGRDTFIQTIENQSRNFLSVSEVKLHLPEKAIRDEKQLKSWVSSLNLNPAQMVVPLLSKGCLLGQLQLSAKANSNGFSSKDLTRIKRWATCLASLCSSLYFLEQNEHE